ncbi:MAG: exosortase/archaeosortase family protein [Candidatus Diapherotrites archaeon]|uniref:Exosortase/archaeosortase family protein n=1 Tax=Candidatus Iainarchaeum sp. TaxID=3101447 RepID=A0A8T3YP18_9ARCH|nr:exosortase/archaeosortase family protein [Candidatus Diapherotrites archaeon]
MRITQNELLFLAKFTAIFAAAELLINTLDFSWLENALAAYAASPIGLQAYGNTVTAGTGSFEVNASCTGLVSASVLAAIIFSLRKPDLKEKAGIFLGGTAILFALNYFRVMLVLLIGKNFGPGAAETAHIISWFTTSAFIIALWYLFTKRMTGTKDFSGFL